MKKFMPVVLILLLLLCSCGKKEEKLATITLDINPSVEMDVKGDKVERISAMNGDATNLIEGLEGKSLDEVFEGLIEKAKENNFIEEDGNVTIILGVEEEDSRFEESLRNACGKKEVNANIIVPKITEEAKNEAKARGVSAAKAAVIMDVMKENSNLQFDDLTDKSSRELDEMKQTGLYCEPGYTLRGDKCEKNIREEKPDEGKTCPSGYEEINGKCYLRTGTKQEPYCKDGLTLKDGKCVGTVKENATGKCSTGTYNSKTQKCEVLTLVGNATKSCKNQNQDPKDQMMSNGRCSGGKWAHDDNTCEGADVFIADKSGGPNAGWCYNPSGDYAAIVSCPSGQTVKDGKCYKATTSDATFTCSKGKLEGTKCVYETSKNPEYKLACEEGTKLYKDRTCIDYSQTKDYVTGYVCNKNARLEGNRCVYYEVKDALKN